MNTKDLSKQGLQRKSGKFITVTERRMGGVVHVQIADRRCEEGMGAGNYVGLERRRDVAAKKVVAASNGTAPESR